MEKDFQYNPKTIEEKWQNIWSEKSCFAFNETSKKNYYYCLEMFPYPSGKIHMGHVRNYVIGDVISRFQWMNNMEVMHPIGWDAFGLPAENAAIKNNIHPDEWTKQNISEMRQQLKSLGIGYDWGREIATCDPEYYKWNQWFFLQMYKKKLIDYKDGDVNWCPSCQTVLANEQVVDDGSCWRCGSKVSEKRLKQWFIKITEYAEELLNDHSILEGKWPKEILAMQKNWIGKSKGAEIVFSINCGNENITVYTTRPDTLFGATFMVLAPEHDLVKKLVDKAKNKKKILSYLENVSKRTKKDRIMSGFEKEGVYLEADAVNPVNGKSIPVWAADYVLGEYGFGAIMAVPAHDQRDYEFAKKHNIPIIEVIRSDDGKSDIKEYAYEEPGLMVNSGKYDNLSSTEAGKRIVNELSAKGQAKEKVNYRLKDWLISRQRYWGTPIPIIHCSNCGPVPVNEEELPVLLPRDVAFNAEGESPLKKSKEFLNVNCPKCKSKSVRETDTMDTFVDSSWYFARYLDPRNDKEPFSPSKGKSFLPVTQYVGGIEHACMHLIYSRYFNKFMRDIGLVKSDEPFARLLSQGMVTLGGSAMSKSKGNVVEPGEIIKGYCVDAVRLFILFASPPEKSLEWSSEGLEGSWRFLNRVWRITNSCYSNDVKEVKEQNEKGLVLERLIHQTIKKVTVDIEERFQFNTAIARLMELYNAIQSYEFLGDDASRYGIKMLIMLLNPFTPHISEELWQLIGEKELLVKALWPKYDPDFIVENEIEIVVQVNGKLRDKIKIPCGIGEAALREKVLSLTKVQEITSDKSIRKVVVVPDKLINIVV
ncbi:MAG: leucine--tRNA ligase [bacterium]